MSNRQFEVTFTHYDTHWIHKSSHWSTAMFFGFQSISVTKLEAIVVCNGCFGNCNLLLHWNTYTVVIYNKKPILSTMTKSEFLSIFYFHYRWQTSWLCTDNWMPSLVSLVHRIFKYIHFNIALIQENRQRIVYNKPTTKQKFKNKENLSGYHTGDEPNIACVDTCKLNWLYTVTYKAYEGRSTLHINLCIA